MNYIKLSKALSYALRHHPEEFGIELDEEGWASVPQLLEGLCQKGFGKVRYEDIAVIVDSFEKKRHELVENRVRALYGHSLKKIIRKVDVVPPAVLYHGTSVLSMRSIMEQGLMPMQRQYVHLSALRDTALVVAARRVGATVLLEISALQAHNNGVSFFKEGNNIWLSGPIPPEYLKIIK